MRPQFPDGTRGATYAGQGTTGATDGFTSRSETINGMVPVTAPATPDAERWAGWGTALKPAHEPIVVARKPLSGTVSANVLARGTGALNVDGCRVGSSKDVPASVSGGRRADGWGWNAGEAGDEGGHNANLGRWPANTILSHSPRCEPVGTRRVKSASPAVPNPQFGSESPGVSLDFKAGVGRNGDMSAGYADADGTEEVAAYRCVEDCPVRLLDEQTGTLTTHPGTARRDYGLGGYNGIPAPPIGKVISTGDSGGASRFFPTFDHRHEDTERRAFYCAKSSSAERNAGLEGFEERESDPFDHRPSGTLHERMPRPGRSNVPRPRRNTHPTVKSLSLMRWLVRLVTPPSGTVLDPFAGSGTTGCATELEGFDFVGIEREPEYVAIAEARIAWWSEHPDGMTLVKRLEAEQARAAVAATGQGSLFDVGA